MNRRIKKHLAFLLVFSLILPLLVPNNVFVTLAHAASEPQPLVFYDFKDGMPEGMEPGFNGNNKAPEIVWDSQRGRVLDLGFNGDEAYVSFPNPYADLENLTGATMMLWVKADLYTTALEWENLIAFVDGNQRLTLQGKPFLCWNNGSGSWVDIKANNYELVPGQWKHFAVTIADDGVKMFVNGSEIGIAANGDGTYNTSESWDTASMLALLNSAADSYLGYGSFWGTTDCFMDSVAFYDSALTEEEIHAIYLADPCVVPADITTGLKAYYSFDEDFTDHISGLSAVEVGGAGAGIFNVPAEESDIEFIAGQSGRAVKFAGVGGNGLRLPTSINSKDYTISFWMNPQEYTDFSSIIFARREPGHFLNIMGQGWNDDSSHPQFRIWRDAVGEQTELNYVMGNTVDKALQKEWTHITYVVNQNEDDTEATVALYVNGVRQQVMMFPDLVDLGYAIPDFFSGGPTEFYLGINWWDPTYHGSIDELYLFERALSEDDVAALHAQGIIEEEEEEPALPTNRVSVHDPSIVKDGDTYYIFGSHMAWAKTTDLINWTTFTLNINHEYEDLFGELWEDYCKTSSNPNLSGNMWAPDVIYNDTMGKWCMYMSINGDDWNSAIVLLTADHIEGPYSYVGPVVYSGFNTTTHPVEKTDVYQVLGEGADLTRYQSTGDTKLNAIDPNVRCDQNGDLWMSFGSWFGGIYMLKLDKNTGLRDYTTTYETVKDQSDAYYGYKIAGGYGVSGEGPYIIYDEASGYYYLYVTYGGLAADGGYNMRLYRSKNIYGPYLDAKGTTAVRTRGGNNSPYGIKVMGNYSFDCLAKGYKAPGHNSALVDDDGKIYLIYHTRFDDGTETHEVRVHQMFMNEDNWLVTAPYEYYGDEISETGYDKEELIGFYEYINHGLATDGVMLDTLYILLEEDGSISGEVTGSWSVEEGKPYVTMEIDGATYKGVFFKQSDESIYRKKVMTFTAIGDNNQTIWGSKQSVTDLEAVTKVAELIKDSIPSKTIYDLKLPVEGQYNTDIQWTSSNPELVSSSGKVNRPVHDTPVDLTARISRGKDVYLLNLSVVIKGTGVENPDGATPVYQYSFEDTLGGSALKRDEAATMPVADETIVPQYVDGKYGKALKLDGSYGVVLDAEAVGETYSIAYWVKPSSITTFGPIVQIGTNFLDDSTARWLNMTQTEWDGTSAPTIWSRNAITGAWPWYLKGNGKAEGYQIPLNQWTHVTLTVDGSFPTVDPNTGMVIADTYYSQLFINGEKIGEGPVATGTFTGDSKIYLGINCWDPNFVGEFDEIKIYDKVLHESEVLAAMNQKIQSEYTYTFDGNLGGGLVVTRDEFNQLPTEDPEVVAKYSEGMHDQALHLDGSYGVLLDAEAVGETYSIAFWAKPETLSNYGPIIQIGSDFLGDTATWLNITKTDWNEEDKSPVIWSKNSITGANPWYLKSYFYGGGYQLPLGEWSHIAVTVDSSKVGMDPVLNEEVPNTYHSELYINGEKIGEGPVATSTFSGDSKVYLGINCWDPNFNGLIDDLKIYDEVLTARDVKDAMDLPPIPVSTPVFVTNPEDVSALANDARVQVSITTDTPDATIIYYVEDSSEGIVYTEPFELSTTNRNGRTIEIEAVAMADGLIDSERASITINFLPDEDMDPEAPLYEYSFENAQGITAMKRVGNATMPVADPSIDIQYADGVFGKALKLDGSYGLELDAEDIGETYSIAYWIKPSSLTTYGPIIQIGTEFLNESTTRWLNMTQTDWDGTSAPTIWSRNAKTGAWPWYLKAYYSTQGYRIPLNEWTHVTLTVDGSRPGTDPANGKVVADTYHSQLFINGEKIGEGPVATGTFSGNAKAYVGINCWDPAFVGLFDEIKIYDTVLTADGVRKAMGERVSAPVIITNPEDTSALANDELVQVSISAVSGAAITYYINGSGEGIPYTGPFEIAASNKDGETIMIEAVAEVNGMLPSERSVKMITFLGLEEEEQNIVPVIHTVPEDTTALANDAVVSVTIIPTISVVSGSAISAVSGAAITYQLNDGEVMPYTGTFTVSTSNKSGEIITIKALAQIPGTAVSGSSIKVLNFLPEATPQEPEQVARPVITTNPADTSALANDAKVIVSIATATSGAAITYYKNGEAFEYTGPFEVTSSNLNGETVVIEAIAQAEGMEASETSKVIITFLEAQVEDPTDPEEPEEPTPTPTPIPWPLLPTIPPTPTPAPVVEKLPGDGKQVPVSMETKVTDGNLEVAVIVSKDDILEMIEKSDSKDVEIPVTSDRMVEQLGDEDITELNISVNLSEDLRKDERVENIDINLSAKLLEKAAETKKKVNISVNDENGKPMYSWSFDGEDLANSENDISDLNLSLSAANVSEDESISKLLADNYNDDELKNALVVNFNHEGVLPAKANVRIYVGHIIDTTTTDRIYVYHYNSTTGQLESLPFGSEYVIDKDGYISLDIIHCSDYVFLPKKASGKILASLFDQVAISPKTITLKLNESKKIEVSLPNTLELVSALDKEVTKNGKATVKLNFASMRNDVVTVDDEGNVRAVGLGNTYVIVNVKLYNNKANPVLIKVVVE